MVKKRYIAPELIVVELASRNAMMSVSAVSTLGVGYRGTTSGNSIGEADVKEQNVSDVNLWDKEW